MIVYKLTSPSNKSYIGLTTRSLKTRFREHTNSWKKLKRRNISYTNYQPKLFYAFDKYDPILWSTEVLYETNNKDELCTKEKHYIEFYDSINNGYNILTGGQDGWQNIELEISHKEKIAAAQRLYWASPEANERKYLQSIRFKTDNPGKEVCFGKRRLSKESIEKMRQTKLSKGYKMNEDQLKARSQLTKDNWKKGVYDNRPAPSEEKKQKVSRKLKGHASSDVQKASVKKALAKQYDVTFPDGHVERITNLTAFCKENSLDQPNLSYRGVHKGYRAVRV